MSPEKNHLDFSGKVALVTGGSRGIGRGVAAALGQRGATVAVVSRRREDVEGTAQELEGSGVVARGYACDVSSFADAENVAKAVADELGPVEYLVNNAGVVRDKLVLRMTPDDWGHVIGINLSGAFNFVRALAPQMLRQRSGRIVNISSVVGLIGNPGQTSYAASKAGLIGFTKSLAKEFAPRGITVNCVAPGYIETSMTDDLSDEARQKMLDNIPLKRLGTVEDVAKVVLFLLSDLADYVTGQVVNCDGGMVMS